MGRDSQPTDLKKHDDIYKFNLKALLNICSEHWFINVIKWLLINTMT